MAFVLVNFSWAFRADIKIPNVANWVKDEVHARIPGDPQPVLQLPLVILFILLIAVLHGDALEPPALADRRRGLLHRQPVPDGLVGFAVQGGVQHALQSEISVRFLNRDGQSSGPAPAALLCCRSQPVPLCWGFGATNGRGWDTREIPALGTFCITWERQRPQEHHCWPPHSGTFRQILLPWTTN